MDSEKRVALDTLDRKILAALQRDATASLEELAARLGASKTPIWNRIRKLREAGIIEREVAILDPQAVGLAACFIVLIRTAQHEPDWLERFTAAVRDSPEILSAHRVAGDIDYVLTVRVADARAYDAFYRRFIARVSLFNITSLLSMEEIKATTVLPLTE